MATKSLATGKPVEERGAFSLDLPAEFEAAGPLEVVSSRMPIPYAVFAQPKRTDQWTALATKLPGLQDGVQVLVYPDPIAPVRLQPMRFTVVQAKQYWVKKDKNQGGKRLEVTAEPKPIKSGWDEEVLAALLVYLPDGSAVACTMTFITVKCPAVVTVTDEIKRAADPVWADQSAAHKMAFGAMAKPFCRVVGTVTTTRKTPASGYPAVYARSTVAPASPTEWKAIKDLLEDPGDPAARPPVPSGMDKLRLCAGSFNRRVTDLGLMPKS